MNPTEDIFYRLNQQERNGKFFCDRLANRDSYQIQYWFKVGCSERVISREIPRREFVTKRPEAILIGAVSDIKEEKETIRICTKFFTGVEIE